MKKYLKQILKDISFQAQHYTVTYRDRVRGFITVPATDVMRAEGGLVFIKGQPIPIHRIVRVTDTRTEEALIERGGVTGKPPVVKPTTLETISSTPIYDVYRFTDRLLSQLESRLQGLDWRTAVSTFKTFMGGIKESTVHTDRPYRICTVMSENPFYGTSLIEALDSPYRIFRGYPHLLYYDQLPLNCRNGYWIEQKLNGSCIRTFFLDGHIVYGTRRNLQATSIPILCDRFQKDVVLTEHPDLYTMDENVAHLNIPEAMRWIIYTHKYDGLVTLANNGYTVFTELFGYGNPIQVDNDYQFGTYTTFLDIRVLDICDIRTHRFLPLMEKVKLCAEHQIPVAPIELEVTSQTSFAQIIADVDRFTQHAKTELLEGFVLKVMDQGLVMSKIKPDITKLFAILTADGKIPEAAVQAALIKVAGKMNWIRETAEAEIVEQLTSELQADFTPRQIRENQKVIATFVHRLKVRDTLTAQVATLLARYKQNGLDITNKAMVMRCLGKEFPSIAPSALFQSYQGALQEQKKE